jgi:predicted  nucleic acid-binding Zn-ribbon protein
MSVEFSNAYQEILLENVVGVIKQNFIFQTQIKLLEKNSTDKESLQKSLSEIKTKYDELNSLYSSKQNDLKQLDSYKNRADQVSALQQEKSKIQSTLTEEKNRIQSALNDEMRKMVELKKELNAKDNELKSLKDYISKLEEIAPVTKLKKIKTIDDIKTETPKVENKLQPKVLSGSSF